ncbi:MAG: tetratricopeptide repeat protein [Bacteroides sp.]|nr:tetratricopeptide repeat protein [Bacteroides sp.]
MIQQRIYEWIKHPDRLNRETLYELRTLLARYPYFQTARLLYLKNLFLLHDISFGDELRKAALYITDRRTLFSFVEGERYTLKELEKQVITSDGGGVDRTLLLIDAFLETLPENDSVSESLPAVPMETTTDYLSYLSKLPDADEEKEVEPKVEPQMKGQEWIDTFLQKSEEEPMITLELNESVEDEEEEQDKSETEEELEDESYFTETLAKIYVKQQRYSKALEIIKKLNLKYPKKNAYFADQIRFLEKLIINTKSK